MDSTGLAAAGAVSRVPCDDPALSDLRYQVALACHKDEVEGADASPVEEKPDRGADVVRLNVRRSSDGAEGGPADVRKQLDDALEAFVQRPLFDGVNLSELSDGDVLWATRQFQRMLNALEGGRAALVAEAARRKLHIRRGQASTAEMLASETAISRTSARRLESLAESLGGQPVVAAVFARGEINSYQAEMVAAADVPDDVREELCAEAPTQSAEETRRAVKDAEALHRSESDAERRTRLRGARYAWMWRDLYEGYWHLRARLDPETGDRMHRILKRAIQRSWRSERDLPESERRTVPQRTADALVGLMTRRSDAASEPGDDPEFAGHDNWEDVEAETVSLIVLSSLETLQDETGSSAVWPPGGMTESGTPLTPGEVRRLACDTNVIPVVMGSRSEVLDVGRSTRSIPAPIRRALLARDQGCVWPGCDVAPIFCVGHHIRHWADGGPTSLANLALLCHRHHTHIHEEGLVLHPPPGSCEPGNGWTWTHGRPPTRQSTRMDC